jgi:hypothetical protein
MRARRNADRPRSTHAADLRLDAAFIVEDLDSLISKVRDVQVRLRILRQRLRGIELATSWRKIHSSRQHGLELGRQG